jgi:hypothetical protein
VDGLKKKSIEEEILGEENHPGLSKGDCVGEIIGTN